MRDDQRIRGIGIIALTAAYAVRTVVVGNGAIKFFQFEAAPFGLFAAAVIILALPETIEMLPFGPSRSVPAGEKSEKN